MRADRRRWLALVVLCVGQLMIVLDGTVVNVALPSIQRQLHFAPASLAWVVNAYLVTFGGLLLLGGRLGDLVGRKRLFLVGLALFTAASMLCGVAPTSGLLVAARFLQGAGAAFVASMVLAILSPMFPNGSERTRALSVFAFVMIGGSWIGLVTGGVVTDLLSWRWIFFVNLPIGVTTLIMSSRLLPDHAGAGIRAGADVAGAILVTSAPMLAVYALIQTAGHGWESVRTIGLLAGAAALLVVFAFVEARVRTPLVPLRIFTHRNLVAANVVRTLYPIGIFGQSFMGTLYLQRVLHYSPLRSGLSFLPNSVLVGFISMVIVPRLVRRIEPKVLIVVGLTVLSFGLFLFSRAPVHASYVRDVLPALLVGGLGVSLALTPTLTMALADVDQADAGLVSGLTNVSIQLGASIGTALLAALAAGRTAHLEAHHVNSPDALTQGYHLGLLTGAGCVAASVLVALFGLRSGRRRRHDAETVVDVVSQQEPSAAGR